MNKIDKHISVVVPVYNSEQTIDKLIEGLKTVLNNFTKFSIILVNDNSSDNSYEKIKCLAETNKEITAINLLRNVGQQKATFLGLKYAKGDYIIIIDDDLAHAPDDIMLLYEECAKGYDVVYGINKNQMPKSPLRNFGSRIRDFTFNTFTDKPKDIKVCSFRIISKHINEKVITADTEFIYISMEILKHTANIANIYVDYSSGTATNYSFNKLIILIFNIYVYYSNQKIFKIKPMPKDIYIIGEIVNGDRLCE